MSISFNHPSNIVVSTDSLTLTVQGGSTSAPKSVRFNANSIIVPPRALPLGEQGALVFDTNSLTMKYHNGSSWIELLSASSIVSDINDQIVLINEKLNTKVDTVTYSSSAVPSASISGTTLNIVFPTTDGSGGGGSSMDGLYTSNKPGSIMHYALSSGQNYASIREQMGGAVGSQNGRNGSQTAPYLTQDGWCLSDGSWWTWLGPNGTVTKQVPNLNQTAYLKGINSTGITKTDAVIPGSGSTSDASITLPQHYHGTGMQAGTGGNDGDDAYLIYGKTWNDGISYMGVGTFGESNNHRTKAINGSNTQTALSTTNAIYPSGSSFTHNHALNNIDVAHFNVAILYNIAEQSTALPLEIANELYLKKAGDSMLGPLNVLTPTAPQHPATMAYVDAAIQGASKSYTSYISTRNLTFGTAATMATFTIPSSTSTTPIKITLPTFLVDEDGQGSEPGMRCYIGVNGVYKVTNVIWVPHDKYGNGLSYGWTPILTYRLPANTSSVQISVRVDHIDGLKNLRHDDGYTWMDVG